MQITERTISSTRVDKTVGERGGSILGDSLTEIPEKAIEAAQAEWVRYDALNSVITGDIEDPAYKDHLYEGMRVALAAAKPFMHRVVTSDDGLLPGTVLQDRTGDVVKLMDNGEWWGTDQDEHTFVDYPATVLVEGTTRN